MHARRFERNNIAGLKQYDAGGKASKKTLSSASENRDAEECGAMATSTIDQ